MDGGIKIKFINTVIAEGKLKEEISGKKISEYGDLKFIQVDGELVSEHIEELSIAPNYLEAGEHQIQVTIEDNSSLLRIDEHATIHAYSVLWTIDTSASSVVDVSEEDIKIDIFPNPTNDILNINMSGNLGDETLITVFNIARIELLNKTVKKGFAPMELNLQNLSTGVYILKFQLSSGHVIRRKIIKE